MLVACSTGRNGVDPVTPRSPLIGRVLSTAEIDVYQGDGVQSVWYSHTVEPADAPGTRVVVVGGEDCPKARGEGQSFTMVLERRRLAFAIRKPTDEALMSDWVIVSCAPKGPP